MPKAEPARPATPSADGPVELLIDPPARAWAGLLERGVSLSGSRGEAAVFRKALGLPTDRPVVMSGHQCAIYHPGILAKKLAARVFAGGGGAAHAWLWVDQDDNDPTRIDLPTRSLDGRLQRTAWRLDAGPIPAGTPTGSRPALKRVERPDFEAVGVRKGAVETIARAIEARAGEASLARQFAGAGDDLFASSVGEREPGGVSVFAASLHETEAFAELFERMLDDPVACVRAYNEAASAHPEAEIRPLIANEKSGRFELPLWRVRPGEPRMPVFAGQAKDIGRDQLSPRALLMTGLVRMLGCDLFIHGTGGGKYDRVTEAWFGSWLGVELAPAVVVSATLRLELGGGEVPTEAEVAEARQRAHKAKHDPSVVGDTASAERKAELLREIERCKEAGEDPSPLFREMHALLEEYRNRYAEAIAALESEADRLAAAIDGASVATARDWAFALYEPRQIEALRAEIDRAYAGA
ncbi:MAG: hypothetical protein EA423_02725 [Phycisphaerales bacterium]|nr:MAG: hypothetical protein EA423_02725 [Phycisphaerales bacterium]